MLPVVKRLRMDITTKAQNEEKETSCGNGKKSVKDISREISAHVSRMIVLGSKMLLVSFV